MAVVGAQGSRGCATVLVGVLLAGCSGSGPHPLGASSAPSDSSSASDLATVRPYRIAKRLVDRSLVTGRTTSASFDGLPRSLSPAPPARAESLLQNLPVRAAMAVEWDAWSTTRYADDVVHFYGADRRWYHLGVTELDGLEGAPYGEGGLVGALSPDGRMWCAEIGDRIVILDLASGAQRIVPLPYEHGVAPRWSTSGDEIFARARSHEDRSVRIDPRTGALTRARWDAYSTELVAGGAHYVATSDEVGTVRVLGHGLDDPPSEVLLDAPMDSMGRPHVRGRVLAIKREVYGGAGRRHRVGPSGLAVYDVRTGSLLRLLASTQAQTPWLSTIGWASQKDLMFQLAGSIHVWNALDGGIRLVTDATAAGRPLISVAIQLVRP